MNDENIARQKALVAAAKSKGKEPALDAKNGSTSQSGSGGAAGSSSRSARNKPRDSGAGRDSRGTKRSRDSATANAADDDEHLRKPEIKLVIPDALKVQLVDDWENVTKKELLVPLPRKPCVKDVLKLYKDHALEKRKHGGGNTNASSKSTTSSSPAVLEEILAGLELYFDKALGQNLLYRFERTQYLNARKGANVIGGVPANDSTSAATPTTPSTTSNKGKREVSSNDLLDVDVKPPSTIYGAEHLLRLFVNLPAIIAHTTMDASSVTILRDHLEEFLQFLVKEKEKGKLFAKYEPASPAYHRISSV